MNSLTYLLALIFSMLIAMPAPAHALTLTLKANATARHSYVALDDVADISDMSQQPAMLDELRRFRVAALPKPGQKIRLTRQLLTTSLRYEYPAISRTIQWRGADFVAVSIESQSVNPDQLKAIAENALRSILSPRLDQLQLSLAIPIPALEVPQGKVRITPLPVNAETPSKRMNVALDISVGDYRQIILVWFNVNAKIAVAVSKTDIGIGTRLNDALFESRIVDIGDTQSPVVIGSVPLSHMRTRLPLLAGQALTRMDIEPAPTVGRQQEVTVQAVTKGITLETNGIALNDGEVGKMVRVRNSRSGEDFIAQVVAPGIVKVEVK